jgi:MYXO-CTERM domain-containing protein
VIDHPHPEQLAGGHEPLGELEIVRARLGLAARVVVDEDHGRRGLAQDVSVDVGDRDDAGRHRALADPQLAHDAVTRVERDREEVLDLEVRQPRPEQRVDVLGAAEAGRRWCRVHGATPELERRRDARRFRRSDATGSRERRRRDLRQPREARVLGQEPRRQTTDGLVRAARSEHDGEEIVIVEVSCARAHDALARAIEARRVVRGRRLGELWIRRRRREGGGHEEVFEQAPRRPSRPRMQRKTASRWRIGGPLAADSADTPARVEFAPMTRPSRHRARSSTLGPLALALATTALPSTGHADAPALEASRTAPETTPRLASYLDASWELERVIDTHGFHIERYRQRIEGLRVDGATAVVRARRDGSVDLVTVESPAQTGATVTGRTVHTPRAEVLRAALEEVPLGFVIDRLEPAEAVLAAADPFEATPRLVVAHRVVVRGRALDEAVSVLVEDSSLRVLRIDDLVRDARGLVFERNTVSDMGMTSEVELPAQSVPGTLTSSAFTVRSCMVSAGGACTPVPRAVPDADGNFLLAPDPESFEDGFTEVMAFYHASLAADRLERDHGFRWRCSAEGPARDDSMQIFTNFTDSPGRAYANAAYVAGSRAECGYLLFGQSGMQDFASDADVVYHELGHAVTDQLSAIVGFAVDSLGMHYDPLAVNEGTSDYWAATIQGDPRVGESLAGLDGIGRSAALRDLDGALRCPNDLFGEGHFDGRIWAGAFWDLRTELGAEKVDALLFATIASIGTAPSLRAAGESAAATADSLVTMGTLTAADGARVREVLGERGLLDCRRVTPLDDGEERGAFSGIALLTGGIGNDVAPIHYSLTLPADATSATIEVTPGTLLGQYAVLARSGSPVGFRGTGIQLDQRDEIGHAGMVTYHASSPAFAPCTTMYFAIESMDLDRGENLFLVQASVERSGDPAARCPDPEPDAGVPDAAMDPDAGTAPDAAMTTTEMPGNCGCRAPGGRTTSPAAAAAALLGLALALSRRRRLVR